MFKQASEYLLACISQTEGILSRGILLALHDQADNVK